MNSTLKTWGGYMEPKQPTGKNVGEEVALTQFYRSTERCSSRTQIKLPTRYLHIFLTTQPLVHPPAYPNPHTDEMQNPSSQDLRLVKT
mmetsp:Transcript_15054/g.22175  ORF Transcript_15054/g.22175 Transcript_15054/m.22175 type:complete len:88 (-) Transcript_15054:771-1034(-)